MIKTGKILIISSTLLIVGFLIFMFVANKFYESAAIVTTICVFSLYLIGFALLVFSKEKTRFKKTKSFALYVGLFNFLAGLVLKFLHLPMAGVLIAIAVVLLAVIFAPLYFKDNYTKWRLYTRSSRDAFLLCLFDFLGIFIVLVGIMFKLQHWPGAGVMAIVGIVVVALSIFAWNQKFKKEIIYRKEAEDKLKEQKTEIEDKNEELEQQSEELKAQKEEISAQRDQLLEQHKSITESILYAKRIQTAVMPKQEYIDEIVPENFILFRPRDKVSGDFYWIKQVNQYKIIVAADCTGHGVPGAILSMLGISFINEIIHKREIIKPVDALAELRRQIKQALRQTGKKGETDDGMDIALVAFNTKTKVLQYAGANNPLYLVQNDELQEIKADRMPIGFYPNERPEFTNHEIQLKTNDIFYLFSDGYVDQFGGTKGMKYRTINFKKILVENHQKPMIIQKELLEQELNNWMKGYDQTDDILVMGVRV